MEKVKRKARHKHKEIDMLKPLDLNVIGSDNDPCFGKHHSLRDPICQRCGDCEVCQIYSQQHQKVVRDKIHKEQSFKDLEEADRIVLTKKIFSSLSKKLQPGETERITKLGKPIAKKLNLPVTDIWNLIKHIGRTTNRFKVNQEETKITRKK